MLQQYPPTQGATVGIVVIFGLSWEATTCWCPRGKKGTGSGAAQEGGELVAGGQGAGGTRSRRKVV